MERRKIQRKTFYAALQIVDGGAKSMPMFCPYP